MWSKYIQWNKAVRTTVNIPKPRQFKVTFVNWINNYCCPSYVTKACHDVSWQNRPLTVQNPNNKQAIANDLKIKSSCTCVHMLCYYVICFHPLSQKISLQSGLHSLLSNATRVKIQVKKLQNVKNNERSHKEEQEWHRRWTWNVQHKVWPWCHSFLPLLRGGQTGAARSYHGELSHSWSCILRTQLKTKDLKTSRASHFLFINTQLTCG